MVTKSLHCVSKHFTFRNIMLCANHYMHITLCFVWITLCFVKHYALWKHYAKTSP